MLRFGVFQKLTNTASYLLVVVVRDASRTQGGDVLNRHGLPRCLGRRPGKAGWLVSGPGLNNRVCAGFPRPVGHRSERIRR
jgi:hypothetical protein